jgi:hypothetical protein
MGLRRARMASTFARQIDADYVVPLCARQVAVTVPVPSPNTLIDGLVRIRYSFSSTTNINLNNDYSMRKGADAERRSVPGCEY